QRAMTLIELIGVLAVLAILAAFLVPALIRQADKIEGDKESASLKSFGDALQTSITRNRYVPSYTNWDSTVASELGVDIATVRTNQARKLRRVFLVDPSLNINGGGLPYSQTSAGSTNLPVSPRFIMLSSISRALPLGLTNSIPSADNFTNIWNA